MTILRLSYAELARHLGRSTDAARVLARRRGWQRVTGNDGRVVVLVDEGELPPERPAERSPEQAEQHADSVRDEVLDELRSELLFQATVAARAEGEAKALREALADLAARLDWATAELRKPFWRRWW